MKAMIIRESGEPSVFQVADIPVPRIGPSQVLVRVAATSVNPVDWKIRKRLKFLASSRKWASRGKMKRKWALLLNATPSEISGSFVWILALID